MGPCQKMAENLRERHVRIQTNEDLSGGEAGTESMIKLKLGRAKGLGWSNTTNV